MITITLWPLCGLGTLVLSLTSIVFYWRIAISIPASIPVVGVRNEVLSKTRAWIRELTAGLATLHEGYFTVGKNPTPAGVILLITQRLMACSCGLAQHKREIFRSPGHFRPATYCYSQRIIALVGKPTGNCAQSSRSAR